MKASTNQWVNPAFRAEAEQQNDQILRTFEAGSQVLSRDMSNWPLPCYEPRVVNGDRL